MRRRFATLDVFTESRLAGNPLAVVLEPEGLDTPAMQKIAREFNLSETVFVFPPADAIDLVASDASGHFRVRTPKLPISINGAGDAIAALFFAHYLRGGSAAEALSRAASSVFGVLKCTAEAGSREIMLVEAQEEFVNPGRVFPAEPI